MDKISLITQQEWALFIVRVTLGLTFILHGSQKVLGIFGGSGLTGFSEWMGTFGVRPIIAYIAAFAELIGGVFLLLGFATEIGAILAGGVMIGAIFIVHGTSKYFIQDGGFEYPFVLLLLLVAIIIGGPGKATAWKIDQYWKASLIKNK